MNGERAHWTPFQSCAFQSTRLPSDQLRNNLTYRGALSRERCHRFCRRARWLLLRVGRRDHAMSNPWLARHGMTSAQYQAEFDKWTGQGFRLREVSGYGVGAQDFY